MLGALLVALAVIGVVASHLSATATPRDRYLVAVAAVPAGTLLADTAAVQTTFRQVALDLPAELAARAVHVDAAADLVGRRVISALEPGDLLLGSAVAAAGADHGTTTFSFSVPADAAVGGALTVGDRIDVLATVGSGADATTAYVVRAAPLSAVAAHGGGLGGDSLRLTVELTRQSDVQALAHALATADVVVVRSPDATSPAPPAYRFDPSSEGVLPADVDDRAPGERGTLPLVPMLPPASQDGDGPTAEGTVDDPDPGPDVGATPGDIADPEEDVGTGNARGAEPPGTEDGADGPDGADAAGDADTAGDAGESEPTS